MFTNISSLQDHILAKHSSQSESVLEVLKLQQKLLNSILAGQAKQLVRSNAMALKQTCILDDIKMLTETRSMVAPSTPSLLITKPLLGARQPVPQGVLAAPQGDSAAPQGDSAAPQGDPAAPHKTPSYAGVVGGEQQQKQARPRLGEAGRSTSSCWPETLCLAPITGTS